MIGFLISVRVAWQARRRARERVRREYVYRAWSAAAETPEEKAARAAESAKMAKYQAEARSRLAAADARRAQHKARVEAANRRAEADRYWTSGD